MKQLHFFTAFVLFVLVLSGCDTGYPGKNYHRSGVAGNPQLQTRFLHENTCLQLKDIGEGSGIKVVKKDENINLETIKKIFLSYHPQDGYVLEVQKPLGANQYYLISQNDFVLSIQNRTKGRLEMRSSAEIVKLSPTPCQKEEYFSTVSYVRGIELKYHLDSPVTDMVIEKSGSALSFCWKDQNGKKIVYHGTFLKDNFVIESGGDFLSTIISYEQKLIYSGSRGSKDYPGWKQEDITFSAYYYSDGTQKEYGFFNAAPQLEQDTN